MTTWEKKKCEQLTCSHGHRRRSRLGVEGEVVHGGGAHELVRLHAAHHLLLSAEARVPRHAQRVVKPAASAHIEIKVLKIMHAAQLLLRIRARAHRPAHTAKRSASSYLQMKDFRDTLIDCIPCTACFAVLQRAFHATRSESMSNQTCVYKMQCRMNSPDCCHKHQPPNHAIAMTSGLVAFSALSVWRVYESAIATDRKHQILLHKAAVRASHRLRYFKQAMSCTS